MKEEDKTVMEVAEKIMRENEKLFSELAKGPRGEYVHALEAKLKTVIEDNKRLRAQLEIALKDREEYARRQAGLQKLSDDNKNYEDIDESN